MVLIKVNNNYIPDEITRLISFYRTNPAIAAKHLLVRDGHPIDLPIIQQAILNDWWFGKFSLTTASRGTGKALVNGTKVLCKGLVWKSIEDIKVGEEVYTPNGILSPVTGVYPQGKVYLCKIIFEDGRSSICSYDHLWNVKYNKTESQWYTHSFSAIKLYHDHSAVRPCVYIPCTNEKFEQSEVGIKNIEEISPGEATCIKIADSKGLFIIDDYIVTHNTFMAALYGALKLMLYPNQRIGVFAPSFRQSKLIFNEFKKFYDDSPLLRECVSKEPTFGNDQCVCVLKPPARGITGSFIKALPIGSDGSKIRGERFNQLLLDEIVHLPESIFRSAIKPMLSTSRNPMQRVQKLKELEQIYGSDIPPEFLSTDNGYIGITSGYYQFNYWWQEILNFYRSIKIGNDLYSLRFVAYTDLPKGFFELDVVRDAEMNDPRHMFLTEWCAEWIADSDGVFPMSLLEGCRSEYVIPKSQRQPEDKNSKFIFGIDIGRKGDATGIIVIEMNVHAKVVYVAELEEVTFQEQAKYIMRLVRKFQPEMIFMDAGGGGLMVQDLLADPKTVGASVDEKIISIDSDRNHKGKRILKMCDFAPAFIEDANNETKLLLEQRAVLLPTANNPIAGFKKGNRNERKEIDLVEEMINQLASITITRTSAKGLAHYDLPNKKSDLPNGAQAVKRKDLYTAFILACKCLYELEFKPKSDSIIVEKGVISELNPQVTDLTQDMSPAIMNHRAIITPSEPVYRKGDIIVPGGGVILTRNGKKNR